MYELVMYDNAYYFERRWVFSRTLTVSEMMKVLKHSYNDVRYVNEDIYGDVRVSEFLTSVSEYVHLNFHPLEVSDYLLES